MVAVVHSAVSQSPGERLAARLDDPDTADALNQLLDHADLIAVLVTGLSEFVSRGDTITDTIGEFVSELKGAASSSGATLDLAAIRELAERGSALAPALTAKLPVIEQALQPGPNGVDVVDVGAMVARAASTGTSRAESGDMRPKGVLGLLKALKDEDVNRAIGFVLSIAKSLGEELDTAGRKAGAHRRPAPTPRS